MLSYVISLIFRKHTPKNAFALRRSWVRLASNVLGIKHELTGKPIDRPALYVCNHRSFSDPLIAAQFVDAYVIAKAEVANYPVINKGAELTGVLYVKREDRASRQEARKAFLDVILNGHNVLVYPEGTVAKTKKTLPYKRGTFKEAAAHNIPVVPMAIEYKHEVDLWPQGSFIKQFFRQFGKGSTYVKLVIGPPFENTDGAQLVEDVENWTNARIAEMQEGWSEAFKR